MLTQFDGLWWLLLTLGPFIFLQRSLHKELQYLFILVTRRVEITLVIFSLIFFPGVLLHELSHWVMAKLLRVHTGGISLIPKPTRDGRLQMGYVITAETDFFRDALIGFAPLLAGGLFVAFSGTSKLGFLTLWDALNTLDIEVVSQTFGFMLARQDFWLWFYLTVAVSSTMLPSQADRRAWLPILLAVILLIGVGVFIGLGQFLLETIAVPVNDAFQAVAVVFAISSGVHLIVLLPTWGLRKLLNQITGLKMA